MELSGDILIQEYLEGDQISIEVAIYEGRAEIINITDKMTTSGLYFAEIGHILPTNLSEDTQKFIKLAVDKAIHALGMKNGIAHIEAKIKDNEVNIIEVGARMPGDFIPQLMLDASGIDFGEIYLNIAMGKHPDYNRKKNYIYV